MDLYYSVSSTLWARRDSLNAPGSPSLSTSWLTRLSSGLGQYALKRGQICIEFLHLGNQKSMEWAITQGLSQFCQGLSIELLTKLECRHYQIPFDKMMISMSICIDNLPQIFFRLRGMGGQYWCCKHLLVSFCCSISKHQREYAKASNSLSSL